MKKFLLTLALLTSQLAIAADVFNGVIPRAYKLADPMEASTTINGYPIWSGEGKWQIFNIAKHDSTGGETVVFGDVDLFQTEGKSFVAMMRVSANLTSASVRWLGEPCKREDLLFKADISKSTWQDNCVTINHITNFYGNPPGYGIPLYASLKQQGIEIPPTILQIQFTHNGSGGSRYIVILSVNPEVVGFARETEVNWGRNPWHKTQSFNDPVKKQWIDALSAWALKFANQMDPALDKKSDAFASIASWRTALGGLPKSETVKP